MTRRNRHRREAGATCDPCDTGAHELRTPNMWALNRRSQCRQLVAVGGGFIGAEVAPIARNLGLGMTIIEACQAPYREIQNGLTESSFTARYERRPIGGSIRREHSAP